jgi:hypothetical protein
MILFKMHIFQGTTCNNSQIKHFKNAKKFVIMIIHANHLNFTLFMKGVRITIL